MEIFIDYKEVNKLSMEKVLQLLEYEVFIKDGNLYGKIDPNKIPSSNEKRVFRVINSHDGKQRCFPFVDDTKGYTNMALIEYYVAKNKLPYTVNQFIFKFKDKIGYVYKDKYQPQDIKPKLTINDLKSFKQEDLKNIILSLNDKGFQFWIDKAKNSERYPVINGFYPDGGQRQFVLKKNPNGEWIAWDRTDNSKLYDCISIIKQYFPSYKLDEIQSTLKELSNSFGKSINPQFTLTNQDRKRPEGLSLILNKVNHRYLALRGLDYQLIQSIKGFEKVLKAEKYISGELTFLNQAFIYRNIKSKETCGYLRRNISIDSSNLKGFSGKKDGLFFNDYKSGEKSTVLIGESFENVFSFYQMNLNQFKDNHQVIFVATSGNPKDEQLSQLKWLLQEDIKVNKVYFLGDNDVEGQIQNFKAINTLNPDNFHSIKSSKKNNEVTITSYNLELEKIFNKRFTDINIVKGEDVNLKPLLTIKTPFNANLLFEINQFVLDNFLDNRRFIIQKSEKNDFNDDLVIKFGVKQYIDDSKKFDAGHLDLLLEPKMDYMIHPDKFPVSETQLAQDLVENKMTAINAIKIFKKDHKPGEHIPIPKYITSELKKVRNGKLKTNREIKQGVVNKKKIYKTKKR